MSEADQAVEGNSSQEQDSPPNDTRHHVQTVGFSDAVEADVVGAGGSIDILLDMKVPVTVTIGCAEMPVQRFLRLGPGSVLKLDKSIDEPVDLYLRDAKFATGSVVVVDNQFAVRIKQIYGLGNAADNTNEVTA